MPETNGTTAETPETPAGTTPPAGTEAEASTTPPATDGKAPKWEGEYDPERAGRLIANLRQEIEALKVAKAPKAEPKDEMAERLAALEARAKDADRRAALATVAAETGVPGDLLVGDDEEAMKAHAARLLEWAKGRAPAADLPGKPRPALTPGHGGDQAAPFDPAAIARAARNRF